ncbi:MAG: polysulfide reductase NrfD [Gracilibacteraceae bacterium]|nr:polysulfide reductase NrfD [Gracilibacteraceae bacterium]
MKEYALQVGFKEQKEWADMWPEMALGAVAGGLFIASVALESALGALIALIVMLIGKGGLLIADLGRRERFIQVFKRPQDSWISRGAWALGLFAAAGAGYLASFILPMGGVGKLLGLAAGALAGFLMAYDGFFLGDAKGVEFWAGGSLPLVFLSSALLAGLGAAAPLTAGLNGALVAAMHLSAVLLAAIALFTLVYNSRHGSSGAKKSAETLLSGGLAPVFRYAVVGAGLAAPLLAAGGAVLAGGAPALLWLPVGLLEIAGATALRYSVLQAGCYSPVI